LAGNQIVFDRGELDEGASGREARITLLEEQALWLVGQLIS
jgi:hypothetical protein